MRVFKESVLKIVFQDGGYAWKRISSGRNIDTLYRSLLSIPSFRYAKLYEMVGKRRGKKGGYVGSQTHFFNRNKLGKV